MEINSIEAFIRYYERTREVTLRVIQTIPPDKLDWTYARDKFTLGDLVRHIAAIERNVFMQVIQGLQPNYEGCGKELADGYEKVLEYFQEMHTQSLEILRQKTDADLFTLVRTLDGKEITMGNFLRALIVHEVHHRGAMCIYLNLLDVITPPVIGLSEKQVIEISRPK